MKTGRTMRGATATAMIVFALLSGCADKPDALIASAKENLANNDRNAAVIQLKNALQIDPDLAEARFLLGKVLLETGQLSAAEKELRKAADLKYPSDRTAPLLVRTLVARGEFKKAVEEFSGAEVTSPEGKAELNAALGQARMAMGDVEAARVAFAAAVAAVPEYPPALVGQARLKASTGDLPGGLMLLETALAKAPTLADGWHLKGDILSAQAKPDEALFAYRKALESQADFMPAHAAIVTMLIRQGKNEDAGRQLEAMKKVAPRNSQTLYLQALLAFQEKNYAAAREALQQLLGMAPDNLLALLLDGRVALQTGSYTQAESTLSKVLQRVPKQRFARALLVSAYMRDGQPAKALDTLKPMLDEGNPDPRVLALAGEVYLRNGNLAESERFFEKAAKLDPANSRTRAALALSHLTKGDERGLSELEEVAATDTGIRADLALIAANTRQRKYDAALAAIAALEKKQPETPLPHNLRGAVLVAKGDRDGARRSFERAAALDQADFPAAAGLARLDLADKKPDEAKKRFEAVLAKDPKNVRAFLAMADLRVLAHGSQDEVVALIGKAVAADPTDPMPRLALVNYYLRIKEPKKAIAAAQETLTAMPDRPEILDAAGRSYSGAGDFNQAIATYNRLAKARPESPLPYVRIAEIHIVTKDNAAARDSLRKALAIKPDLTEARVALAALDFSAGRPKEALASARELQKQYPTQSIGYVLEGDIYAQQNAWSEAIPAYRNGLKKAGTSDLAARLATALRAGKGGSAEADKFIALWARDHPDDRSFRHYLAQSSIKRNDFADAEQQYKALLESQPNDALVLNNLAWVAGQLKDPKALEYAEKADKLAPNNPAIQDTLGMLLVEKGDTKRGIAMLRSAASLLPNHAPTRLHLARALIADGQKEAAKKELDELARLGDKFSGQAEVAKLQQGL